MVSDTWASQSHQYLKVWVARNLGKTLRAFQPTIRELQDVSKEFKSALEREISLDDDPRSINNMNGSNNANLTPSQPASRFDEFQTTPVGDPNGALPNNVDAVEEYVKIQEQQLNPAAAVGQDAASENQVDSSSQPQAYSSEEYLKVTEEQLKKAAEAAWRTALPSQSENQTDTKSQPLVTTQESAAKTPPIQKPDSEN